MRMGRRTRRLRASVSSVGNTRAVAEGEGARVGWVVAEGEGVGVSVGVSHIWVGVGGTDEAVAVLTVAVLT